MEKKRLSLGLLFVLYLTSAPAIAAEKKLTMVKSLCTTMSF